MKTLAYIWIVDVIPNVLLLFIYQNRGKTLNNGKWYMTDGIGHNYEAWIKSFPRD